MQIELKNVYYKYQDSDKWAIDDFSLKIKKGKQFVLTGDNGAGKSTLFKLLLGIEKCQYGEILINDYNLADLDKQWWQSQIGWVAQEPYIFSATIRENITLGRDFNLNSGQKRRLGLTRALIGRPKLLLLDEPMENLDVYNEKLIQRILSDLKNKVTVIIIGHRLQTLKNADELIYLQQGKLVDSEKIKDKINYFSEIIEGERSI